jgi:hypothetical protein
MNPPLRSLTGANFKGLSSAVIGTELKLAARAVQLYTGSFIFAVTQCTINGAMSFSTTTLSITFL